MRPGEGWNREHADTEGRLGLGAGWNWGKAGIGSSPRQGEGLDREHADTEGRLGLGAG